MKATSETIVGVVGSEGDLGTQLVSIASERGFRVLRTDIKQALGTVGLETTLSDSEIVHFCISEPDFNENYELGGGQLVILHDSVMATSKRIRSRHFDESVDIVHMLMNETPEKSGAVVVEQNTPHLERVSDHFRDLGMAPITLPAEEHDHIMARSQAPLAMLVQLLLPELQQRHDQHVLTPSGDALLKALEDRASKWTDKTMTAILKNPLLPAFLDDLRALLEKEEPR